MNFRWEMFKISILNVLIYLLLLIIEFIIVIIIGHGVLKIEYEFIDINYSSMTLDENAEKS